MKKKANPFLIALIAFAVLIIYFANGGTIALGDVWKEAPAECLLDDDYNTFTEVDTVYIGKNGKDGAMVFSIHNYQPENISNLEISFYKTKKKSDQYLYTSYSSYEYEFDSAENDGMQLQVFRDAILDNYAICVIKNADDDESIYQKYPELKDSEIHTVKFVIDNNNYQIKYIIKEFETKKEAQNFKSSLSHYQTEAYTND